SDKYHKTYLGRFLFRWFVSSLGLWVAAGLLGNSIDYQSKFRVIVLAGLVLTLVNTLVKPIVVLISLPALLITLGLFMIVINGLMVLLASKLYGGLHVTNFGAAMLAGMVIGLVNYLVLTIVE
ncbi:MAG TPA: phage holin family protein, partial [Candidatus Saccharimonadales bacterium]|nr:phage holin family protein [Candidatus Saccharimonadales bacterium]